MANAFFTQPDKNWYQPTVHCRGPWDENSCHAGPPTGLIARALEQQIPSMRLTRLTVDLIRPIPYSGFRIETEVIRSGRTVSTSRASLINANGKTVVTAAGLHMREQKSSDFPSYYQSFGLPAEAKKGLFPIQHTLHGLPAFNGDGVEVRYPDNQNHLPGPTIAWMKTVPLLENEPPSPFQKICPLADCGNAFGRNAEAHEVSFMNTDLTVVLHRDPEGDWLGTQSVAYWEKTGIGLADALLFDEHGVVGRALQTLLLRPYK